MAVFTPVEEAQRNMVAPWEEVEKAARDSFTEVWVDDPYITISMVGSEEELVLMDQEGVLEAGEGTLGEAVGIMRMTPVEEGEDLTMQEQISKMNAVIKQLATVG